MQSDFGKGNDRLKITTDFLPVEDTPTSRPLDKESAPSQKSNELYGMAQ